MNKSSLLATVAMPFLLLQFSSAHAVPVPKVAVQVHVAGITRIAMSVADAQAQLDAALAALADAQANGGDVAAAQAAVDAAQAALAAAQVPAAEPVPEAAPEPAPQVDEPAPVLEPDPAPAPDPVPDAAPSNDPAPVAEPAPSVEPAAPVAEPAPAAPDTVPEEPTKEKKPVADEAPVEPAPDAQPAPDAEPTIAPPAEQLVPAEPAPAADAPEAPKPTPAPEPAPETPATDAAPAATPEATDAGKVDPTAPADVAPAADAQATVDPVKIEENKAIAADPAKSTETIVLPVANGAAVLDSDKEADTQGSGTSRKERQKQRAETEALPAPTSDAQAQAQPAETGQAAAPPAPVTIQPVEAVAGQKIEQAPVFIEQNNVTIQTVINNRTIINVDNQIVVRSDDRDRLERNAEQSFYEQLPRGRVRETIVKSDSSRIVTIRNRFGDIIQRSVISPDGEEYVLFYSPELDRGRAQQAFVDPGDDLPPMRLVVPLLDYIIDTSSQPDRDFGAFLRKPPVERVERVYSLDEVKYSARIRDKVRRIDLDTITFASGRADISLKQANTLKSVAKAIRSILARDPGETFLIEGHTDAVGSYQSNLVLSDQRAESVANILTDVFDIPAENLATQGYGERYLKVITNGPEELNRRVTIRRVTALVRPVASK